MRVGFDFLPTHVPRLSDRSAPLVFLAARLANGLHWPQRVAARRETVSRIGEEPLVGLYEASGPTDRIKGTLDKNGVGMHSAIPGPGYRTFSATYDEALMLALSRLKSKARRADARPTPRLARHLLLQLGA